MELGGPGLPWGRLTRFLNQLPADSAFHRSVDPEGAGWSTDTYLLAHIADSVAGANWQRSGKGKRPKPIPRPHAKSGAQQWGNAKGLDPAIVRARLDAKKPKKG